MRIKIITVHFDYEDMSAEPYRRLSAVFKKSIAKHVPEAELVCHEIAAPFVPRGVLHRAMVSNTEKLRIWANEMQKAECPIVFCDCDMMATGDLSELFSILPEPDFFDVAFTARSSGKYPINGGAVYARPNENARRFFTLWRAANNLLFANKVLHRKFREKYAGMNQAALGYLLEEGKHGTRIAKVPCSIWNACDDDWIAFSDVTRLVHVKGELRRSVLGAKPIEAMEPRCQELARIWRGYENE
jgi:hypothetical protein